ncbi:Hypothetical protein A7982_00206 [Minicystis rosea]|nr:Hypothetical protein A7982_00206 [Minicystis rosea]
MPALLAAPAAAQPAPAKPAAPAAPAAPAPASAAAPAAPAAAKPAAPRPVAKKGPAKPPEPELPDPEVKLRVIAPSAQGLWTMRIENEGSHWVRVPADARLLRFTLEPGDTMSKKAAKPTNCQAPAGLRPDGFPEPRALMLAPGDAYVETFDPRLFCFGKDAKVVEGGVIVRARYGWDAPKNAKKVDAPFAVEGTEYPATIAPQKQLFAPTIVLSWEPPDPVEEPNASDAKPDDDKGTKADKDAKDDKDTKDDKDPAKDDKDPAKADKDAKDDKGTKDGKDDRSNEPKPPVDENAPKIELKAGPYTEAVSGARLTLTLTATNVGRRATLAAVRSRMFGFRIEGPDGVTRCTAGAQTRTIARDGYRPLKPGGSISMTVFVEEACGRPIFRRPGLYKVTPSLHLVETGVEHGLAAYTGVARAKEPTLVRIHTGHDSYHSSAPKPVHTPKPEGDTASP